MSGHFDPFDHTAKTFRRLLWSQKFSRGYCGENLGGVKRHLWLGASPAPPLALAAVAALVKLAARLIVHHSPGSELSPDFLIPESVCFVPSPDYQSRGRATGRFLRQPLSQTSQVLNRESVLCQKENDEKQCNVRKRPTWKNFSAKPCGRLKVG